LLPVNDTGSESSPYSARSAFALDPAFINIQSVAGSSAFEGEINEAKESFEKSDRVEYYRITTWKRAILRKIFDNSYDQIRHDKALTTWIERNEWAKPYCVYCTLKQQNNEASWKDWSDYRDPDAEQVGKLWTKFRKDCLYHAWMQYVAEMQFCTAVSEVSQMGLHIKGDIPILINEDSADVWADRKYFSLADRAGAPPDMFSYAGQNWGFPTYRWDVIEKDNFSWWRKRLAQASKFYHAYRIDHVLGFFRIWTIPEKEVTGILGHFEPSVPLTWDVLHGAGFCRQSLEYLRNPNYSVDQLRGFVGRRYGTPCGEVFRELARHDRPLYLARRIFF
jgi:4-alpha-glucanotransferase